MTDLEALLKAKDMAIANDDGADLHLAVCNDDLREAEAKVANATKAKDEAVLARLAAHKAIHDHLAELGDHYLTDDHGTLTVFRAVDHEPGWVAQQPIPGRRVK